MSKSAGLLIGLVFLSLVAAAVPVHAAGYPHIKQKMNYQGLLANSGGTPYTGTRSLVFRIYDQVSGGSALWTETQGSVAVANGIFNVVLGSVNAINIPFRKEYWLEVQVETETLTPRHLLSAASFALASRKVVYQQVITVAQDGGDTCTVYGALQMIAAESPTPGAADAWLIEVQAGTYVESNSIVLPDYVSLCGQGKGATTLSLGANDVSLGNYCSLQDLTLSFSGGLGRLSLANSSGSAVRNCAINTVSSTSFAINLGTTTACEFSNNFVTALGGSVYVLYMQSAVDARIENNVLDFTQCTSMTGIYAANTTNCVIWKNLLKFEGATDSCYGISVNNNTSSSRVSYNVFFGDLTTPASRDITLPAGGGYPVRGTYTGPYGIGNQGSSGSELPAF